MNKKIYVALIIIMIIASTVLVIVVLNNHKTTSEKISKVITEKQLEKYIDITQDNFNQNNSKGKHFVIQGGRKNKNGSFTLFGRVYQEIEDPKLTAEQYKQLSTGKVIEFYGTEIKESELDFIEGKNDHILIVKNNDSQKRLYYTNKNADGSATLTKYNDDFSMCKGTDTYMKITLGKKVKVVYGKRKSTIKKYYKKTWISQDKDMIFVSNNVRLVFDNGRCVKIAFDK